jgi:hypothetical protein
MSDAPVTNWSQVCRMGIRDSSQMGFLVAVLLLMDHCIGKLCDLYCLSPSLLSSGTPASIGNDTLCEDSDLPLHLLNLYLLYFLLQL